MKIGAGDIVCKTVAELRQAIASLAPTLPVETISPPFPGVRLVLADGKLRIEPPRDDKQRDMWDD